MCLRSVPSMKWETYLLGQLPNVSGNGEYGPSTLEEIAAPRQCVAPSAVLAV